MSGKKKQKQNRINKHYLEKSVDSRKGSALKLPHLIREIKDR
jgi:hypothetical protein